MKNWHVMVDGNWVVIESEECPDDALAHAAQETCLNWNCGSVGGF